MMFWDDGIAVMDVGWEIVDGMRVLMRSERWSRSVRPASRGYVLQGVLIPAIVVLVKMWEGVIVVEKAVQKAV